MYGEIEEIFSDIFCGIVLYKYFLSDVLQYVFEVCLEFGYVYVIQCYVKSNVCQFVWDVKVVII